MNWPYLMHYFKVPTTDRPSHDSETIFILLNFEVVSRRRRMMMLQVKVNDEIDESGALTFNQIVFRQGFESGQVLREKYKGGEEYSIFGNFLKKWVSLGLYFIPIRSFHNLIRRI